MQCLGRARAGVTGSGLVECEREATWGDYCYFCSKVAAGLITTIDGKTGPGGHELSWKPTEAARNPGAHTLKSAVESHVERRQLLNEWDDETNAMAISLLGATGPGPRR